MRVSEYYSLGVEQPSLDFVDVRLDTDIPLFVDPTALYLLDTEWGVRCRALIHDYFSLVLEYISSNQHSKAKRLLAMLSEPNETHLGLSSGRSRGHGMGSGLADKMWQALVTSDAVRTGLITDLEDTALMIDGIASDVISDIVTNIIREPLLEYTKDMCEQYGIPLENRLSRKIWNIDKKEWEQKEMPQPTVVIEHRLQRLMLVPKAIVRKTITYDAGQYYNKYLLEQLQEEDMANGLVRIMKTTGEHKPPTKQSIKERLSLGQDGKVNEKEQNRKLTPERLDVLRRYKQEANETPKPVLSHNEFADVAETSEPDWDTLLNNLINIEPGRNDANQFEKAVEALFNALFHGSLAYPMPQTKLNEGRKRVDITYFNVAKDDFFGWVKDHYTAPYIFVECKNYNTDIGNEELDQLSGRFGTSKGQVGISVSRKIANRDMSRSH